MRKLPTEQDQHWLLISLAALIEARGVDHFLSYPIVEPTRVYFPDPWAFSQHGLDRVVRRLMQFAALGHLDLEVRPFSEEDDWLPSAGDTVRHTVAGLFCGIEDGRCLFGFNVDAPADAEHMAGVMCHEVAHAYRAHHRISVDDENEEERLTDLTACYLGFGILAANNSFRYRTSMELDGGVSYQYSSFHATGYLTSQEFCYLLGLQMVVRNYDRRETRRTLRHLEADQSAFARAAFNECQSRSEDFPQILGLPLLGELPDRAPLEKLLLPLPEFGEEEPVHSVTLPPGPNAGRPVFRVRRTMGFLYGLLGFVLSGVLGGVLSKVLSSFGPLVALPLIGMCAGWLAGRRRCRDVCSDPDCGTVIPAQADECPGCEGTVKGRGT